MLTHIGRELWDEFHISASSIFMPDLPCLQVSLINIDGGLVIYSLDLLDFMKEFKHKFKLNFVCNIFILSFD